MNSNKKMLLTGPTTTCMVIALLLSNSITNLCFAQPLDSNTETTTTENSKHLKLKENAKPLLPTKEQTLSKLEAPLKNIVEDHQNADSSNEDQTQRTSHNSESDFPDRRGFFTGHRIPLELFPEETLKHIELIGETTAKPSEALERVPPGHPRRIPLELFSDESLRRIDGLDVEEDELFEANFPRRIPLEDFSDETLKRLDLVGEKKLEDKQDETSKPSVILPKLRSYVDSDDIRESEDDLEELKRTPRFAIHGGISDDPEDAAHHFPALTIGGEGDPAFLDTLLSYYN